jgi:phosphoribosylformimino-5-aminoimidazole carboxamide ribotide isomerase
MQVLPVIDLLGGQVVRGIAGERELYRPIQSRIAADAQPATVARAFVQQLGLKVAYVADLDAIACATLDDQPPHVEAYQRIAEAGLALVLDAGMGTPARASQVSGALHAAGLKADYGSRWPRSGSWGRSPRSWGASARSSAWT